MVRATQLAVLTACLVLGAAACLRPRGGGGPSVERWLPLASDARLYADNAGGIRDSVRTVVRDAASLRRVWQQATAGQASPPPVPNVDFNREMVVVVAAGRMTPQDEVRVDSVQVRRERDASGGSGEVMSVMVRTVRGCGRFNAPAYPVEIIRLRRFDGRVSFVERATRAECS